MRNLAERTSRLIPRALRRGEAAGEPPPKEPKPPLPLPLCFMLSHLEEDGPVRLDGVKLAVFEVMGLELDEPKLGAFAGALNALDFALQLLIRQHPPDLGRMRGATARGGAGRPAPARRGRHRSRCAGCSPRWNAATAFSTGASTPSARPTARTTCGACWARRGWRPTG